MSAQRGRRPSSKKKGRPKGAGQGCDDDPPEALDTLTPHVQIDPELAHASPNMSLAPMLLDPEFAEQVTEDLASDAAEALRLLRPPPRVSSGIGTDAIGIDLAAIGAAPVTGPAQKPRGLEPNIAQRASTLRRPADPTKGQIRVSRGDPRKPATVEDEDEEDTKI